MTPKALCIHFFPRIRGACDAGHRAPDECGGCPAYMDGTPYLGVDVEDQERGAAWWAHRSQAERVPRAIFRQDLMGEQA